MRLETRRQKQKRIRNAKIRTITVLVATIGVIAVFAVVLISGQIRLSAKSKETNAKLSALQQEMEVQRQRTEKLQERKEYTQSREYVEEVAKNKLGLIYPDEIIFRAED